MIGRHVGHFYVIRSLGAGGMGVVYEAQDTRLPRSVALKFLKPALAHDLAAVRRFKREARLSSILNHPNICTVLDVSEGDEEPFIAMELLRGASIKARLARSPLSLQEIVAVVAQAVEGLAAAHEQGVLHRDITPGNIFVTEDGLVKLLDFGLAKSFAVADDGDVITDLTQTGTLAGTIHYMAPELFDDGAVADPRSDLYSLGAVLYQLATGGRPFEGRSRDELIDLIRRQPHIPLRRLAPHQPAALERLVDRLLAKAPADRYQDAGQVKRDLDALGLDPPVPPSTRPRSAGARSQAVAVLPFREIGRKADDRPVGAPLAADIGGELARTFHVAVRPPGAGLALGPSATPRELGATLDADLILEGSVQFGADRLRVTAHLVEAATERPAAPAVRVDRATSDYAAQPSELARVVAGQVVEQLRRSHGGSFTRDPEAAAALKRGLHHLQARFQGGWRDAIEQFEQAIRRDPHFAAAHVALGSVYEFLGFYSYMKPVLAFSVARESIERALALDDTLSAAHLELALIRFGDAWDWEGAEQSFRRALQLDRSNAVARVCYSWLLVLLGRTDAALAEAKIGRELTADGRFVLSGCAQTMYLARRFDEAIALCDECLRQDPAYLFALSVRGQCYELTARWGDALTDLERAADLSRRAPFHVGVLGHCYGRAGRRAEALALLEELERHRHDGYVPPQCYVYIHAGLGDRATALDYQERAYQDGASPFNYFVPSIRDLYALDPQYKRRLEQMRLAV